jgi:hypothetical protein
MNRSHRELCPASRVEKVGKAARRVATRGSQAAADTLQGGEHRFRSSPHLLSSREEPSRKHNGIGKSEMVRQIVGQVHLAPFNSYLSR